MTVWALPLSVVSSVRSRGDIMDHVRLCFYDSCSKASSKPNIVAAPDVDWGA